MTRSGSNSEQGDLERALSSATRSRVTRSGSYSDKGCLGVGLIRRGCDSEQHDSERVTRSG